MPWWWEILNFKVDQKSQSLTLSGQLTFYLMIQNFHYQSTMVLEMSWAMELGQDDVLKPLRSCPKPLGHALIKSQWYAFFSQNPNLVDSKPLSLMKLNVRTKYWLLMKIKHLRCIDIQNPNLSTLALMNDFWSNPAYHKWQTCKLCNWLVM